MILNLFSKWQFNPFFFFLVKPTLTSLKGNSLVISIKFREIFNAAQMINNA